MVEMRPEDLMVEVRRRITAGAAALALLFTMGAEGGCKPPQDTRGSSGGNEADARTTTRCDANTSRGATITGTVVGDMYYKGGPYCIEVSKTGHEDDAVDDNSGVVLIRVSKRVFKRCTWNMPWPECATESVEG